MNPASAAQFLIDQCRLGFVLGHAIQCQIGFGEQPDKWDIEEREWSIPGWFWQGFTASESSSQNFERNAIAGRGRYEGRTAWINLTGVHYLKTDIEALARESSGVSEPAAETPVRPSGGRPPAAWWDELRCVATIGCGNKTVRVSPDVLVALETDAL